MTMQEEGHSSQVRLPNGVHWEPESCWDDIYNAIDNCRVLCYVVGMWALNISQPCTLPVMAYTYAMSQRVLLLGSACDTTTFMQICDLSLSLMVHCLCHGKMLLFTNHPVCLLFILA